MYRLEIIHPDGRIVRIEVDRATDVLAAIPGLLAEQQGCERIVVYGGTARLFAVDCAGNQLPLD